MAHKFFDIVLLPKSYNYSFNKYLLSIYCVPNTIAAAGNIVVAEQDKVSVLMKLKSW